MNRNIDMYEANTRIGAYDTTSEELVRTVREKNRCVQTIKASNQTKNIPNIIKYESKWRIGALDSLKINPQG